MNLSFKRLGARLSVGLAAAVAVLMAAPVLATTHGGQLALAAVFVAGSVPVAPTAAGVFRPTSTETLSIAGKLASVFNAFINAPKAARAAQLQDILAQAEQAGKAAGVAASTQVVSELLKTRTGQFSVGELGGVVGKAATDALAAEAQKIEAGAGVLGT
ncbi:MAG: hypothetical protein ACRYFS_10360 [Janthinobacterium lividum]